MSLSRKIEVYVNGRQWAVGTKTEEELKNVVVSIDGQEVAKVAEAPKRLLEREPPEIGFRVLGFGKNHNYQTEWVKVAKGKWVAPNITNPPPMSDWSELHVTKILTFSPEIVPEKPVVSVEPETVLAIVKGSCRGCGRIEHFTREKNPPPGERNWRCVNCGCYSTWVDLHTSDDLWVDLHTSNDLPQVIYEGIKN